VRGVPRDGTGIEFGSHPGGGNPKEQDPMKILFFTSGTTQKTEEKPLERYVFTKRKRKQEGVTGSNKVQIISIGKGSGTKEGKAGE